MKLYLADNSGNSYKVRILLSLLGVGYEKVVLDTRKQQHKEPAFLKLNPRGEVPVLEDDGVVLWDSAAILVYLARRYGGDTWLPPAPGQMAQVMQWVALAGNEIQFGLQYARRGVLQNRWTAGTLEQGHAMGRVALDALEGRLKDNQWLALGRPTVGDVACYPYVAVSPEGGFKLEDHPAVAAWVKRFEALPGWVKRV